MEIAITRAELRINMKAREWCKLPYPGHPHGCPNYGHRGTCPPQAPLIQDFIDLDKQMYLIVTEFDFQDHTDRMRGLHPDWSERQARCCLYWQGSVNKELEQKCSLFKQNHPSMTTTRCPEAMGVNVLATALFRGLPIEKNPKYWVFKIALAGYPRGVVDD